MTGASVALLRYHAFVPGPYLEYGARLLRNGVDRQDVATATIAALRGVAKNDIGLFKTIVHTNHHMPVAVVQDFARRGPGWCEEQFPGARHLIEKYDIALPSQVEQHDLSQAEKVLGWSPAVGFLEFLRNLQYRDEQGLEVRTLQVPGELPQ